MQMYLSSFSPQCRMRFWELVYDSWFSAEVADVSDVTNLTDPNNFWWIDSDV